MKRVWRVVPKHWGKAITLLALAGVLGGVWWVLPVRPRVSWSIAPRAEIAGFSADGKIIVTFTEPGTADEDNVIVLWDAATGREKVVLRKKAVAAGSGWPFSLAWLSENSAIAGFEVNDDPRFLRIDDEASGSVVYQSIVHQPEADWLPFDCAVSPDGRTLAFRSTWTNALGDSGKCEVRLWDATAGRVRTIVPAGRMTPTAFSSDSRLIATVIRENQKSSPLAVVNEVAIWDIATGTELARFPTPHRTDIATLAFSADGSTLTAAFGSPFSYRSRNEPLQVIQWDIRTRAEISHRQAEQFLIGAANGTPSEHRYSYAAEGTTAHIYDLSTGQEKCALHCFGDSELGELDVRQKLRICIQHTAESSPDGQTLAVRVTRFRSQGPWQDWLAEVKSYVGWKTKDEENFVDLWNLETGRKVSTIVAEDQYAFSPDGQVIAVEPNDRAIEIWDIPPRKPLGWFLAIAVLVLAIAPALWWRRSRRIKHAAPEASP